MERARGVGKLDGGAKRAKVSSKQIKSVSERKSDYHYSKIEQLTRENENINAPVNEFPNAL